MPSLMLGNIAKEAAKMRFRSFNITLPAIPPASTPTLRMPLQQRAQQPFG